MGNNGEDPQSYDFGSPEGSKLRLDGFQIWALTKTSRKRSGICFDIATALDTIETKGVMYLLCAFVIVLFGGLKQCTIAAGKMPDLPRHVNSCFSFILATNQTSKQLTKQQMLMTFATNTSSK